jgi:predicted Zn-dependent protease
VIRIVTLADFDEETLDLVVRKLQGAFNVGTEVGRNANMPSEAYDPASDAYDGVKTIAEADDVRAFGDDKILFLTDRPLSLPLGPMGKGPVDGYADFGGLKAVATTAGLAADGPIPIPEAIAKRATRQVGHLFGLHHCYDARCAMLPGWADGFAQNPDVMLCPFCREKSEQRIQRA